MDLHENLVSPGFGHSKFADRQIVYAIKLESWSATFTKMSKEVSPLEGSTAELSWEWA